MKDYSKLIFKIFVAAILMAMPLQATLAFTDSSDDITVETFIKDKFEGGWAYTVAGAPEGYEEGFLLIVADGNSYKVQIQTGGGTMKGENVTTKGSTIMFDVMVEGDKVAVSLKVAGSTISGTSTSSQGTFAISGTKTLSQE
ncbi:hypothetical protein FGM00_12665 [Aggregatimonas sangjinii]|uniref:Uncharacterized protein n=1 Tax=Aggregatimonas sangjinii TaxID=2583587 RepID=A0A5B7SRS1_9FLAO|nr:hypothetical protein [Aggregatimonas sangjinii]QCX00922.1 hypothetical protein FGM00_12665 [Aggregatimonas sangjinii]